jgi:hypothetical protein
VRTKASQYILHASPMAWCPATEPAREVHTRAPGEVSMSRLGYRDRTPLKRIGRAPPFKAYRHGKLQSLLRERSHTYESYTMGRDGCMLGCRSGLTDCQRRSSQYVKCV